MNDAGWNGRKSPCCRPRVPCWCSWWKLSFFGSNAGADCWWQRRMVVNSCRDQRWDKGVSFKFPISGKTSSWGWTPARHRTAFLQSAINRSCWPVGMNGMVAEAAYSKSGWITEMKNCLLAVGVLYVRSSIMLSGPAGTGFFLCFPRFYRVQLSLLFWCGLFFFFHRCFLEENSIEML